MSSCLDHWHALFATRDGKILSRRMQILDRWIGRQTIGFLREKKCDWQDGYYDTKMRSSKQFQFVCNYIEENPVRASLAESISSWKWSSANPAYFEYLTRPWPWRFEKD